MSDEEHFDNYFDKNRHEEWDEDKWEQFFQREDDQKRQLQELIDKYGYSEQGLRRAFEEMGYEIPDDLDEFDEEEEIEDDPLDELSEDEDEEFYPEINPNQHLEKAHPLFRDCYQFILHCIKIFHYSTVAKKEHPIVKFQSGLFECMSKLIRAGYDDIDFKLEAEKGLILAALKRARKALYHSLFSIPDLNKKQIVTNTNQRVFRMKIMNLLQRINREIAAHKRQR